MGGTKSKVDDTPDEESDESTQSLESTSRNTEYTRHHHGRRHNTRTSPTRKGRQSNRNTPTPDEILDKPFTYRSRKERLLESLNVGAGDHNSVSTDEFDSYEKARDGKISVQKLVENIQANLNVKSGSTTTIKEDHTKLTKNLNVSNDSLINIDKKSHRRKSASSKVVSSSKVVKPTGVEEKIIESLIQPRKRQHSLQRSIKSKKSTQSMNVLSNPVKVTFDNEVSKSIVPKPPEPPPIDFSEGSASDREELRANKKISTLTSSIQGNDVKPFDSILSRGIPSHLKELKLRFSNDVPRSPHEDNLNTTSIITENSSNNQPEKPLNHQDSAPTKSYFTNNVPIADSLHILSDKAGSPKTVIRGAKDQDKRCNEHRSKHRKSQGAESNQDLRQIPDNASDISNCKAGQGNHHSRPVSASPKSILRNHQDDDVIQCFPIKAEYNEATKDFAEGKTITSDRSARDRDKSKNSIPNGCKTARTQTSCLGLVDSSVQTYPDLELQGHRIRKDNNAYKAAIDNNAKKVLRRVSMDKSVDRKPKDKRGKRYRNGSTQWEEIDLLDISSCILNQKEPNAPKDQQRSKSRPRAKIKEKPSGNESIDCQDCYDPNEVCCMHLQVIPGPSTNERTRRQIRSSKHPDLLGRQEPKGHTPRQENCCEGCSSSGLSSSGKKSAWATYSTSSGRSRELSLLSPFRSSSSVRSKSKSKASHSKDEDVYRQMEELGLGFLRDGEWVPTDIISRTLWQNLEKTTQNCQATWRRRSRSLSHAQPAKGQ